MDKQNQSVLDDDRLGRLLFKLTLPSFLAMAVMTLYNVVDTMFIGRYVGPLAIAALTIVFPIQMLSMGVGQMMGMGGASLMSRSIGAHNIPKAEHALGNAITSTILAALIIMLGGFANVDFWLQLIGASEAILPYARDYMTIILFGMFFMTFAMASSALVRAEGNARVPMIAMIIGAVSNIILDAIFIIPLDMGVKGAALATVIAQILSVTYVVRYYFSGRSFLKIHPRNLIIEWSILKSILAIGIASLARTVTGSVSAAFVNRMLIGYGGDLAMAAFGVITRLMMFVMMPGIAIGQGLQPILGFNYGAKRYDRAIRVIKLAIAAASACSITAFLVLYFSPEPFIRIFTTDSEVIALGSYAAKRIFLAIYLVAFIMVGSIVFQSIGKAVQSFVTSISRPVMFLIPLIVVLPRFWQLDGVLLSFPLSDALTFLLTLLLLIPQVREFRSSDLLNQKGATSIQT